MTRNCYTFHIITSDPVVLFSFSLLFFISAVLFTLVDKFKRTKDIVLATFVWVFHGKEIFAAYLLIDIQVSYSALDWQYLVSGLRVCMRRI